MQHTSSIKDVQALESELASLRKRRGDLEEIELTVMERVEEREDVLSGIAASVRVIADEVSVTEQERDRSPSRLRWQREELERDRSAVASGIAGDLSALYEKRRTVERRASVQRCCGRAPA